MRPKIIQSLLSCCYYYYKRKHSPFLPLCSIIYIKKDFILFNFVQFMPEQDINLLGPCRISGYYPVSVTIRQFFSYPVSGRIACVSGLISGNINFLNLYIIDMNKPNFHQGKIIVKIILTLFCL